MKNIGNTLKKLREENGMTRKDAADKLKDLGIDISDKTLYGYESGRNSANADMFLALCKIYKCANIMGTFSEAVEDVLFTNNEWNIIEKYRLLDDYGKETVDMTLERETQRVKVYKQSQNRIQELENQMAKLSIPSTIIEMVPHADSLSRFAEYYHSASAGGGVFILGNEASQKISVPATPENEIVDYVIKVSGDSMEPDYQDGDSVMVSQRVEMKYGDVGIFVVNGKVYIKEYGKTELISRNPRADNIKISEYDNIVCMGKVVGKIDGPYEIISD